MWGGYKLDEITLTECISRGLTPLTIRTTATKSSRAGTSEAGTATAYTQVNVVSNGSTINVVNIRNYYDGYSSGHSNADLYAGTYIDLEHLGKEVCKGITSIDVECVVTRYK